MTQDSDVSNTLTEVATLLRGGWEPWPGGYPDQIELALIDAVFSIRAKYGQPADRATGREATGVRAVVDRWAERENAPGAFDDLTQISTMDTTKFSELLHNRTVTSGRLESEAVHEAAGRLVDAGITISSAVNRQVGSAKEAYTSVKGLGWVTFQLLRDAAGDPGRDVRRLDHAIRL